MSVNELLTLLRVDLGDLRRELAPVAAELTPVLVLVGFVSAEHFIGVLAQVTELHDLLGEAHQELEGATECLGQSIKDFLVFTRENVVLALLKAITDIL